MNNFDFRRKRRVSEKRSASMPGNRFTRAAPPPRRSSWATCSSQLLNHSGRGTSTNLLLAGVTCARIVSVIIETLVKTIKPENPYVSTKTGNLRTIFHISKFKSSVWTTRKRIVTGTLPITVQTYIQFQLSRVLMSFSPCPLGIR